MFVYVLVIAIALLGSAAFGVGFILRHRRIEHQRIARYAGSGREQPKSIVCPKCARRSYSETAVRTRYCPSCKSYHDQLSRA